MIWKDWICNYLGVERAVNEVVYNQSADFKAASLGDYTLNGTSYGQFKTVGNLNYLKVHAAGHEVAYYRECCPSIKFLTCRVLTGFPGQSPKFRCKPSFKQCKRNLWYRPDRGA